MNSSERLQAALAGAEVDRPPFSFWYNFGLQHMSGDAVADIHIAFARRFELDYLRVMNSYPYPLSNLRSFDKASDFLQIPSIVAEEGFWGHQLRALDKIVRYFKNQIWVLDSVDSPWTVLCKLASPEIVLNAARRRPEIVKAVLDVISSSQAKYVAKAIDIGVNGIFFTLTEAAYDVLDPLSHEELCQPYNNVVLEAASSATFNVLRIDSKRLYFDTLKSYRTQAVSWPHFSAKQSLRSGVSEWKRSVIGGINHETIAHESPNNINAYFEKYAEEFFQPNVFIGPSGILPSDISPYVLDGIGDAVRRLPGLGRFLRNSAATKDKEAERALDMEEHYASRPVKEELRNYSRRERAAVRVADEVPEEVAEVKSNIEESAALSLENQDFSAAEVSTPQNRAYESEELQHESAEAVTAESESKSAGRAPRWAARLVRRDYEREDKVSSREFSKDDPRRFDMAYRQSDKNGHRDGERRSGRFADRGEERRSGRLDNRGEERRGSRLSSREGRRSGRFEQRSDSGRRDGGRRDGGRRSGGFSGRNGERSERFASGRSGRNERRTDRFSGREGRRSNRFSSYEGRQDRKGVDSGVKRIRVPRERRP
ncbi:MAG: uroporphyrinogen decarboxylase family protein [Candidatus Bruticola sp.]